ncbi:MAG: 3-hydroxybutyryl-CoA dehydrogenase [Acidimicrobiia bacterium]
MTDIQRVGVIGCGLMGAGITEVCARSGVDVVVRDINDDVLNAGKGRITASFDRAVKAGKLTAENRDTALGRITFTTDLGDMADRDLVIEAASENESIKTQVFRDLDAIVTSPDAILATNTSSIPIVKVAVVTKRPENVLGVHFFMPAPVMPLVELVRSISTSDDALERSKAFVGGVLGKTVIVAQDRSGFVVNALLVPYILSAVRMYEGGYASREDIDTGMVAGCNMPMGPLALADLVGLDTLKAVADSMYDEFKEPLYAAPPLLQRMVAGQRFGRKNGRGFYDY